MTTTNADAAVLHVWISNRQFGPFCFSLEEGEAVAEYNNFEGVIYRFQEIEEAQKEEIGGGKQWWSFSANAWRGTQTAEVL